MSTEDFATRLETPLGTSYKVVNGFPIYEEDMETASGEDEWIIQVEDIDAVLDELIPQNTVLAGVPVHADSMVMRGYDWMRVAKVRIEAVDATRPIDPYNWDFVTTGDVAPAKTYGPLARVHIWYTPQSDNIFTETTVTVGAEFLQVPQNTMFTSQSATGDPITSNYVAGQAVPTEANTDYNLAAYKHIPTAEWEYKLRAFINPPWSTFFGAIGKINSKAQASICESAVPETVLFSGLAGTKTYRWYRRKALGSAWALSFKMSQRHIIDGGNVYGWNHVYKPKTGIWTKLERAPKGSGKFLYASYDLGSLFGLI